MSRDGLLAPPGEVDRVLETVLTNLQATRKLTTDPVFARVLLTSPLESYTVGRTILLSRGLIDVLPDEASLAAMLAHELAHMVLGHTRHTGPSPAEEQAADAQMVALLKDSPYRDELADAGLFLRAVSEHSMKLKNLIPPHLGERAKLPVLVSERVDQVAALPLGGRVVVDPWTGGLELSTAANVPLASARERSSLAVTPLVPYLRYVEPRP